MSWLGSILAFGSVGISVSAQASLSFTLSFAILPEPSDSFVSLMPLNPVCAQRARQLSSIQVSDLSVGDRWYPRKAKDTCTALIHLDCLKEMTLLTLVIWSPCPRIELEVADVNHVVNLVLEVWHQLLADIPADLQALL